MKLPIHEHFYEMEELHHKYAVRYWEILARTIIVEADTYEETEEKIQAAVDDSRIEKLI